MQISETLTVPVDKIGIWDKIKHDFGLSHALRMFIDFINRAEDAKNLFIKAISPLWQFLWSLCRAYWKGQDNRTASSWGWLES
ncbi:MAG: hypothetical protein J6W46_09740 [Spirochaetaceae bacterium]|nr:hypothetical protein [Spirochaetaceae bacterium]